MCKIALTLCIRDITYYPAYGIIFSFLTMECLHIFCVCLGLVFRSRKPQGQYLIWDIPPAEVPVGFFLEVAAAEGWILDISFWGIQKPKIVWHFFGIFLELVYGGRGLFFKQKSYSGPFFITFGPFLVCQECWKTMFPKAPNVPKGNLQPDERMSS